MTDNGPIDWCEGTRVSYVKESLLDPSQPDVIYTGGYYYDDATEDGTDSQVAVRTPRALDPAKTEVYLQHILRRFTELDHSSLSTSEIGDELDKYGKSLTLKDLRTPLSDTSQSCLIPPELRDQALKLKAGNGFTSKYLSPEGDEYYALDNLSENGRRSMLQANFHYELDENSGERGIRAIVSWDCCKRGLIKKQPSPEETDKIQSWLQDALTQMMTGNPAWFYTLHKVVSHSEDQNTEGRVREVEYGLCTEL